MVKVDDPMTVAEVTAAFHAYEAALLGNDIEGLNALFWDDPRTLRYGIGELNYSYAEIAQFRRQRGPVNQARTLRNTRIKTFGRDFATADTEFIPQGSNRIGRQSQAWVRTDAGWKIVSAHVSFIATPG
jgi:hypothetical protein